MKWTLQKQVLLGYVIAALLFLLIALLFFNNMTMTMDSVAVQRQSHFLIVTLENLLSHVKDAETGQRGYLLTGSEAYLEPYNVANQAIQLDLSHLKGLTKVKRNQKKSLLALTPFVYGKMAELQKTIELRKRQGLSVALRVVVSGEGKRLMDQIRQRIQGMESKETTAYTKRGQLIQQNFQWTLITSFAAGLFAIVLLGFISSWLFQEMSIRQKLNINLEAEIQERKNMEVRLIKSEERFRSMVEGVKDYAILMLDPQGYIETWNEGAKRMKGYEADEIIGKHFSIFYPPESIQHHHPEHELEIAREQGRFEEEGWRVCKDGSMFWANVVITALYDKKQQLLGFTKVSRDLTERRKADIQIQELNMLLKKQVVTLEALNKELEAFSYSVSHDLRAPLRSIDGFSKMLLSKAQDKLTTDEQRYLSNVCENAQRMGELIDDLLKLSRLSRAEMQHTEVDLSGMAREILSGYQAQEPEREVALKIQDGLAVMGDANLLKVLMENLLGNAWKFTNKTEKPIIEVGETQVEEKSVYFVRDNGAGFNMKYVDKLFGVFQRLHQMEEFPGTGIGLATVQRVILRHGGRIWAEGAVDRGATFYFALN